MNYLVMILTSMLIVQSINSHGCTTIFGCEECHDDPTMCTSCMLSLKFHLVNKTCVKSTIPNCRQINKDGLCIVCNPRFVLASKDKCDPITPVENCLSYQAKAGKSTCIHCKSGFSLTNGACRKAIPSCLLLNPETPEICAICIWTYSWNGTHCAKREFELKNCVTFDLRGVCSECEEEFYLKADTNQCLPVSIANCQAYTPNENNCLQCNQGYYLNSALNSCQLQEDPNCQVFVRNVNACQTCKTNFQLDVSGKCTAQSVKIDNCLNINEETRTCTLCNSTYYVENGLCVKQSIANCERYQSNTNNCATCQDEFFLKDNTCLPVTQTNCNVYKVNLNECFTCNDGYYVNNGSCLVQSVANCDRFVANSNNCRFCKAKYYLSENSCLLQNVTRCSSYLNNTNSCNECDLGYYLADFNDCRKTTDVNPNITDPLCSVRDTLNTTVCLVCSLDYYLSNGICARQNVTNCTRYIFNQNVCVECSPTFFLNLTGHCEKQNVENCAEYLINTNVCVKCNFRHSLRFQVECVPMSSCLTFESETSEKCLVCASGYYALNGVCRIQTKQNCKQYTNNTNDCISCVAGAYLKGVECLEQSVPFCRIYVPNKNQCAFCANTYFIDSQGLCQLQNVTNCVAYVPQTNRCTTCEAKHLLTVDFKCQPPGLIENCQNYTASGSGCLVCNDDYYVRSDAAVCLKQNIAFCVTHFKNSNQCRICEAGYTVDNGGNCLNQNSQIPNCYLQSGLKCLFCVLGYKPAGDELSCIAADAYNIGVNTSTGLVFLKYNPSTSSLTSSSSLGDVDINDQWFISRSTETRYNIISRPRTFSLTGFSTSMVLITNTPGQLTQAWELIPLKNGNYHIKNSSSNFFISGANSLGTTPAEITLLPV